MMLPAERLYLPFEAGPFRMAMSLQARDPNRLVEIDERYPAEMAERRGLMATRHHEVFAAQPGSGSARAEVLTVLAELLPRVYPDWFVREGAMLYNRLTGEDWNLDQPAHDPLELAGRLVQEDLCLIDPSGSEPVLSAAILCAPSRWRLGEKIGRPLAAVHGPVPLYAGQLSRAVDRFMRSLRPGKLAERVNWSLVDDDALFQLGGKHRTERDPSITPETAVSLLFLRVERQTLMRLPVSGSVLFAIHVHSYPLTRVLAVPGAAQDLAAAVRTMPDDFGAYKSLPVFRDALLAGLALRTSEDCPELRMRVIVVDIGQPNLSAVWWGPHPLHKRGRTRPSESVNAGEPMSRPHLQERTYTREEFRLWCAAQSGGRYERVGGHIVAMAPERIGHVRVKNRVVRALERAIRDGGLACEAMADGVTVETGDNDYEPDALVNCGPPPGDDEISATNPVVIIEVLSPSTAGTDTGGKLADYFQIASVSHYLIVHPSRRSVIHHRRGEAGSIATRILASGEIKLDPPGLSLMVEEFYTAG